MIETAITINPDGTPEQLAQTVSRAEALGFTTCYVADQGFTRDIYVTLSHLASTTSHIRLGPGITHPYTRHPATSAVGVATLDELSGGRAFLGLGAGGSRTLVPLQIERRKPLQTCRETAEIARLLWQGSPANYQGEFFQLSEASIGFPCRADIEIHWAARGPKMLALGGELADVNIIHAIPHFGLADVTAQVRAGAQRSDRPVRMQYAFMLVFDDASREVARARTIYRLVDSPESVKQRLGLSLEFINEIRHIVATRGPKAGAHLISDEILQYYIYEGSPKQCAANLQAVIQQHSFTGLTLEVPDPVNADALLSFAGEILNAMEL